MERGPSDVHVPQGGRDPKRHALPHQSECVAAREWSGLSSQLLAAGHYQDREDPAVEEEDPRHATLQQGQD